MRKILLSLCTLAVLSASAQDKKLVRIDTYSINTDAEGVETTTLSSVGTTNYYDKSNNVFMTQNSYSRTFSSYNADGSVASVDNYSWGDATGWALSSTTQYEYDAQGRVIKSGQLEAGTYTLYTYDEKGGMTKMENYYSGTSTYAASYNNTYNDKNQLLIADQIMSDGVTINQRTIYTYNEDGSVNTEEIGYFVAEGEPLNSPTTTTYTYNEDGSIAKTHVVSNSRWGLMVSVNVYVYATYSPSFIPQNVKAAAGQNSTVTVSWDAVSDASAYIVIYDQKTDTVTTTSHTTGMLLDGEHQFYVQAIIGGEAKNISDAAAASVKDAGKLPAKDFKVISVEAGEDQNGTVVYNTTVQFSLPENHSEILAYNLFYSLESAWSKVVLDPANLKIEGNTVTASANFYQYQIGSYNSETYEYDLNTVPLFIVLNYASGNADKSEVEYWDYLNNVTAISAASSTSATPASIYSVSGAKIANAQKGINIIKMSNGEVKKVLVK